MRIITFARIREFVELHADSDVALRDWYEKTKNSKWNCFTDIKQTFNNLDSVGNNRFVFNIRGNNYRLVAIVLFAPQKVYIRFIGTHDDYDKIDCSNI